MDQGHPNISKVDEQGGTTHTGNLVLGLVLA